MGREKKRNACGAHTVRHDTIKENKGLNGVTKEDCIIRVYVPIYLYFYYKWGSK
jgi:hypothetical protein